ncbi:MAG: 23S rRNA (uracil(1939)-C(5))-methyltransferase RlmD [Planctomycetaceae bacterium]|nr:23S rRNA (uracil(1939)-C(5))-methyltransferase RlmD [Planctomycetaceae bacterium]
MNGAEAMGDAPLAAEAADGGVWSGEGRKPRRDDPFELEIAGLDERGAAVGSVGQFRVRVQRSSGGPPVLPGARVAGRVLRRRRDRVDGEALAVLEDSADRVAGPCPHTAECGGCSFQELDYAAQLREKQRLARRLLGDLAADFDVRLAGWDRVLGADAPFHYRNKMDFTFSARRWRVAGESEGLPADFALGLFARGRHDKVLDLTTCALAHADVGRLLDAARELARHHGLVPWDSMEHTGFLRHLVSRAPRAGGLLVNLVTSADDAPGWRAYTADLLARVPSITTLVHSVSTRLATVAVGEREFLLHGPGWVEEELLGARFRISAGSFFQTNTAQAERLFALARQWIENTDGLAGGALYDLYCGGGAIGIVLAPHFECLVGLELVESAVLDARGNAERNGVSSAEFLAGDVPLLLRQRAELGLPEPRLIVLDPPRVGLQTATPELLGQIGAPFLLLVSCNLTAAARDIANLRAQGYRVTRAALVDLFPHTPHLEGLFLLERACRPREVPE